MDPAEVQSQCMMHPCTCPDHTGQEGFFINDVMPMTAFLKKAGSHATTCTVQYCYKCYNMTFGNKYTARSAFKAAVVAKRYFDRNKVDPPECTNKKQIERIAIASFDQLRLANNSQVIKQVGRENWMKLITNMVETGGNEACLPVL